LSFDGKIRREWHGKTFGEALRKLTAWLEIDEKADVESQSRIQRLERFGRIE
jgi:hypothetical protein